MVPRIQRCQLKYQSIDAQQTHLYKTRPYKLKSIIQSLIPAKFLKKKKLKFKLAGKHNSNPRNLLIKDIDR